MDAAQQKVDELENEQQELETRQKQLWKDLYDAKERLAMERMKTLGDRAELYTKKLHRIKWYVDEFGKEANVSYAFRKVEGYSDDFHEPMEDPLDWKIAEYDLLDMDQYVEIQFDYHNEAVKDFVVNWLKENLPAVGENCDMFAMNR
jgi:hypothetical protein